jgi:endoglucanase
MNPGARLLVLALVLCSLIADPRVSGAVQRADATPTRQPVPLFTSEAPDVMQSVESPVAQAPEGFRRGVNLSGAEFTENVLPGTHGVDYFYPTPESLDYYRDKGLTLIRLPFRWERLQPKAYGDLNGAERRRLDTVVMAAHQRGMQVILAPFGSARYYGAVIGSSSAPTDAFADFWRRLAAHYRDNPGVWAYGLMNEPYDTEGHWPDAAQAAVSAIRDVDAERLILVPGDHWSDAHLWMENNADLDVHDPVGNLMYEAHVYFDSDHSGRYDQSYDDEGAYEWVGVDRVRPFIEWCESKGRRCFIGEYGVPGDDPRWLTVLGRFLAYLDEHAIGGTYWAGGPWWGDYPLSVEPRRGRDRPQMGVLVRHLGNER